MEELCDRLDTLQTRLASSDADVLAAQRLRYQVFVTELGASGKMVDHDAGREADRFDDFADHLLLEDLSRPEDDRVVGVYRLMHEQAARAAGQFYCADEYNLEPLTGSGLRLLELGRSCLLPAYRGGAGMHLMWQTLSRYIAQHQIDLLFGVASFHGTDPQALAQPLSLLHQKHLAPPHLRVRAKGPQAVPLNILPTEAIDRVQAVRQMPALIKAYLRLGGRVGADAFVDLEFNTTDICLLLEKSAISALQKSIYSKGVAGV